MDESDKSTQRQLGRVEDLIRTGAYVCPAEKRNQERRRRDWEWRRMREEQGQGLPMALSK